MRSPARAAPRSRSRRLVSPRRAARKGAGLAAAAGLASLASALAAGAAALDLEALAAPSLERHVRFLASDELGGRETGSAGLEEAARYLGARLRDAGLEPAGDDGTFLQRGPLERLVQDLPPRLAVLGADGAAEPQQPGASFSVQGSSGFEGRLRVARVASREDVPAEADAELALYLAGGWRDGQGWLEEAGHPRGKGFGALIVDGARRERSSSWRPVSSLRPPGRGDPEAAPLVRVNGALRERFATGAVEAIELAFSSRVEEVSTHNVLARIPGAGLPDRPELAREVLVLSAHYDHLGRKDAPDAVTDEELAQLDLIYNGADDDASGTACLLGLAEAFAAAERPARTLVFLFATGEERGLLGTRYYLEHPAEPLERTICNLNFEMLGRPDAQAGGAGRLWLTGHERSNLLAAFQERGLAIGPDVRPEQGFFRRSDNYAFAVLGIVAQTLSSYDLHSDYHQVTDEADTLDYAHLAAAARASYDAARLLADGELDPAWLEGGNPAEER
jgi:hypothetical protein